MLRTVALAPLLFATATATAAVAEPAAPTGFVPRAALVLEAPTPSSRSCRKTTNEDADREDRRERAAVDAALRAQGFVPLAVTIGGPAGRGVLAIGPVSGCGGAAPIAAMTAAHEVFVVAPTFAAKHTRTVRECANTCRGVCGVYMPPRTAFAVVPPDATLVPAREIRVPIDTRVSFRYDTPESCAVP